MSIVLDALVATSIRCFNSEEAEVSFWKNAWNTEKIPVSAKLITLNQMIAELEIMSTKFKTSAWPVERKTSREKFSRMDQSLDK